MRKTSEKVLVEPITPSTESFSLSVYSDPDARRNLIGPDLAPGSFQRWLYGTASRSILVLCARPIGVVTLVGRPPRCFFGYALAPEFRGRGLARLCLEAIESHVRDNGYKTITTNVASDNAASVKALNSAGFRRFQWMEKGAVG